VTQFFYMALQIGIVGLPNVGKSTLFNALTKSKAAEAANYPFCTIDPNVGIVAVPDKRLDAIAAIIHPEKIIPASIEFKDIAGLVKGASKGEGLGNKFLAAIREVDSICHVVRVFENNDITHVEQSIDPKRDREIIETELQLADLDAVVKRIDKTKSTAKSGNKEAVIELSLLETIKTTLESGTMIPMENFTDEERIIIKQFNLLTTKPIIYAANVAEDALKDCSVEQTKKILGLCESDQIIHISAKIEEELIDLSPEDAQVFLDDLGVTSSGLDLLIQAAYNALGYQTYFTAGVKEVRAWTMKKGFTAPQAAGVIHTDFERGFIRAETIAYADFIAHNGEQGAKNAGKLRSEGKEYIVNDGDVIHFKFNV
jgi:ribosome-binding ATPase